MHHALLAIARNLRMASRFRVASNYCQTSAICNYPELVVIVEDVRGSKGITILGRSGSMVMELLAETHDYLRTALA
jgi:hypothetical protein